MSSRGFWVSLVAGGAGILLVGVVLLAFVRTDAVGAQVPTTLPTSPPTTEPPPSTTAPPTTARPTTTERSPVGTTDPPAEEAEDPGQPSPTGGSRTSPPTPSGSDEGGVPPPDVNTPDAVQLGEEEDALITSSASGKLPAIFPWLGLVGVFAFVALLAAQWALTNPSRRGSRTL